MIRVETNEIENKKEKINKIKLSSLKILTNWQPLARSRKKRHRLPKLGMKEDPSSLLLQKLKEL